MKSTFMLLLCLLFSSLLFTQDEMKMTEFAIGFNRPVDIAHAGDDRLFIVEQAGVIKAVSANGKVASTPFLDIRAKVKTGGERGLVGLAFHPNYSSNGYFYINYISQGSSTTLARYTVSEDDMVADANSEMIMLVIPQPFANHNGGCVKFGPDGFLYMGMGDGGSAGDPQDNAQDMSTLLGKMLRLDVDTDSPYGIPVNNPFVNNVDFPDEIFASGLRNPWRFSFDRITGDLWMGDVGQNRFEEVNYLAAGTGAGADFGWNCYEGNEQFDGGDCGDVSNVTFPVHTYPTSESVGESVTGGFVYRGTANPEMQGKYIYGDFVTGKIWALENISGGEFQNTEIMDFSDFQISTFGENVKGELFMAALGEGKIYQFGEANNMAADTICTVMGGALSGDALAFCIDGEADNIPAGAITVSGNSGPNGTWVITDDSLNILGIPRDLLSVNFEDAGVGTCLVHYLTFGDTLGGAEVGANAADLTGCFVLAANPIEVTRTTDGSACEEDMTGNIDCSAPTNLAVEVQNSRVSRANWDRVEGTRHYIIEIRFKGETRVVGIGKIRGNSIGIYAPAGRTYEIRVGSICVGDVMSDFTDWVEYTLPSNNDGFIIAESRSNDVLSTSNDIIIELPTTVNLFPNPTTGLLNIQYATQTNTARLTLQHISGQVIRDIRLPEATTNHQMDISELNAGFYLLSIREVDKIEVTKKVLKQKQR